MSEAEALNLWRKVASLCSACFAGRAGGPACCSTANAVAVVLPLGLQMLGDALLACLWFLFCVRLKPASHS